MTIDVTITGNRVFNSYGILMPKGTTVTLDNQYAEDLISQQLAVSSTVGQIPRPRNFPFSANDGIVTLTSDYTLRASDDGKQFAALVPLNINIPGGLSPRPRVIIDAPPTGNVTINAISITNGIAAPLLNGLSSSITRAFTANPAGIAVRPVATSDSYGISGT